MSAKRADKDKVLALHAKDLSLILALKNKKNKIGADFYFR